MVRAEAGPEEQGDGPAAAGRGADGRAPRGADRAAADGRAEQEREGARRHVLVVRGRGR